MPILPNLLERTAFLTLNLGPAPIIDMWNGPTFWAVHTALKLGIFDALDNSPKSLPQLADTLQADARGLQLLIQILDKAGYVKLKSGHYTNSAMTQKWLMPDGETNFTPFYLYWGALMQHFMPRLEESIKTGEHMDMYTWIESQPEVSQYFQEGMVQLARFISRDILKALSIPPQDISLLDLGGGHGEYSIALCKKHQSISAVVFDSEQALVTGKKAIHDAGLSERIKTHEGNFLTDNLPDKYDMVLVFNIVHGLSPSENIALFQKIKSSLHDGGQIIILEQVHGTSPLPYQDAVTHILSLAYFHLVGGQVYTAEEIEDWLQKSDFKVLQRKKLIQAGSILLTDVTHN